MPDRTHTLDDDLGLAIGVARRAGEGIRARFARRPEVSYKSPDQPVTEADRRADRSIREALELARPGYAIVSEESAADQPLDDRPTWVVDPLDGTVNFVEGRPEFAVCIGLLHRGTPVLGAVYNPMTGTLYSARSGGAAFRDGVRIEARTAPGDPPTLVVSWSEAEDERLAGFGHPWRRVTVGSTALKVMRVVEGGADAYVSFGRKELWDLCAPAAIAAAAGATLHDLAGRALRWDDGVRGSDGLIVVGDPGGTSGGIEQIARRLRRADQPIGRGGRE